MIGFAAETTSFILAATAPAILMVGVIDDLRSRKFHNWLFLTCTAVAFFIAVVHLGFAALLPALLGFLTGFAVMLPLVAFRIVGAGDLKLMAAFGAATTWNVVLAVAAYSLVWGAIFGVLQALAQGRGLVLARNLMLIAGASGKSEGLELNRIPYTVALFLGWLTYLTVGGLA